MPCTYVNMAHKYMRMVCIAGAVSTICAVQIVCFLAIKGNKYRIIQRVRKRLLLLAKNIHKNKYLYSLIEWGLFSLTFIPYIIVAIDFGGLCGVLLFIILWYIYIQKIWLTGIKFLYFYFVASVGLIIGCVIYHILYSSTIEYNGLYYLVEDMVPCLIVLFVLYVISKTIGFARQVIHGYIWGYNRVGETLKSQRI